MSAVEEVRRETERGGSVKLIRNAKGDVQLEVKAYVDDESGALDTAAVEAQGVFDRLTTNYGGGS